MVAFLSRISLAHFNYLVIFVGLATGLSAQTTGTILGLVTDPSGAGIPGARVKAENLGTGLFREAATNTEGRYLIPSLPLGTYSVTVEASGFKTFVQSGILLEVNDNDRVDARLEIGAVTETIIVEAEALAVDTQSSTVGETVDNIRVRSLPLNGRNVLALAQLLPGVGTATNINILNPNARTGPTVTVSGAREGGNNIQLDGTSMVQLMYNRGVNLPNPDAIQEFKVLTNTYSAEYGRGYGGIFLGVSRSGTNDLHGSLFEYLRNDNLNARNFFSDDEKPKLTQNQFGGSLGGPIAKNKIFAFGSYQGVRVREQTTQATTFFPPTEAELRGDFSHSTRSIIDPNTGQPFPNNMIPSGRFDQGGLNFVREFVPPPNRPDGRHVFFRPQMSNGDQFVVKGDYLATDKDRVDLRYYYDKNTADSQGGGVLLLLAGDRASSFQTPSLNWTRTFSPNVLNEFHASFFRINNRWNTSPFSKAPRDLGIAINVAGPNPNMGPGMNVAGRFNGGPLIDFYEIDQTWEISNKLSWIHGRHSMKFGFEQRQMEHASRPQFNTGSYTFDATFTGNAMADYLLGRPIRFSQLSQNQNNNESEQYQAFAQDDIKVSRKLTLNLGLRYEVSTPWVQAYDGRGSTFAPGVQSTRYPDAPMGLIFRGDPGVPDGIRFTDKNNFMPRFGFAYDLFGNGRTALRGAYGIFSVSQAAIDNSFGNESPPWVITLAIPSPPSTSDPYQGADNPFPYDFTVNPTFPDFPLNISRIDPFFRDGYVQQYNFNIQQQMGGDWLLQAGYVGSVAHKLSAWRDPNYARNGFFPEATAGNIQQRRPYPRFALVMDVNADANSSYNSFQASARKRFSKGYTFQLAYTYAKSIDNRSGTTSDDERGAQNPDDFRDGERGLSNFYQKHVLAVNGVWDIPFFLSRGFLTKALGGWQLSGQLRAGTGTPFSVFSGRDIALSATGGQRVNVVGDAVLTGGRSKGEMVARQFNTGAFALPAKGRFGNSGRNALVGPAFAQTDLAVNKRFTLSERLGRIEFRAEFFNLFNNANFDNPVNNFPSPAFGQIVSAKDARVIQFALRYDF